MGSWSNEGTPTEEPIDEEAQVKMRASGEDIDNGKITPEQAREEMQKPGLPVLVRTPDQSNGRGFSEETETLIIPVGTPIVTVQRGSSEVNQAELTDITKGTILRVWKNDETVSFVQILDGGRAIGNSQGADGEGPGTQRGLAPGMGGGLGGPVIITR